MRPIHLVKLDKTRPAVIITRAPMIHRLKSLTVVPITSTVRGLSVEVRLSSANGLSHDSVANCDNVTTIDTEMIGRQLGFLLDHQEAELTAAIMAAFDLET